LIFLVAHPRKTNTADFRNDDVSGSGNITNLAHMVINYGDTRDEDDPGDRLLKVTKNRMTGTLIPNGFPLWFQESSKRISEVEGEFDWKYSWETDSADNGFSDLEDLDITFGEDEDDE
jgi:hypothetical protein